MTTVSLPHGSIHAGFALLEKGLAFFSSSRVKALTDSVRTEMQLRAAMRELRKMDDHALADIGINRTDIEDVVRGRLSPQR